MESPHKTIFGLPFLVEVVVADAVDFNSGEELEGVGASVDIVALEGDVA